MSALAFALADAAAAVARVPAALVVVVAADDDAAAAAADAAWTAAWRSGAAVVRLVFGLDG